MRDTQSSEVLHAGGVARPMREPEARKTTVNMLDAIGNTPIVELRRVRPARGARVMVKLESANPTGSMKDRIALAMVTSAAADGRLVSGGRVVEYTGGSRGPGGGHPGG